MNFETKIQLTVQIENKLGQLAEISEKLSENNIELEAISTIGDEMRFICNQPESAVEILETNAYTFSQDEVISIRLRESKGRLSDVTQKLSQANINIDYVYATAGDGKNSAKLILKVSNIPMAKRILDQHDRGVA